MNPQTYQSSPQFPELSYLGPGADLRYRHYSGQEEREEQEEQPQYTNSYYGQYRLSLSASQLRCFQTLRR